MIHFLEIDSKYGTCTYVYMVSKRLSELGFPQYRSLSIKSSTMNNVEESLSREQVFLHTNNAVEVEDKTEAR